MLPPRPLLALCLLLLAGLWWHVGGATAPTVPLAEAAFWEGQSVTVTGWVAAVHPAVAGSGPKVDLVDGSAHALALRLPATSALTVGDRVSATGRLLRQAGILVLTVEDPGHLAIQPAGTAARPGWPELARDPAAWTGRPIALVGTVASGRLTQGSTAVALGSGPWPRSGTVAATGTLSYDESCLCQRFSASEVRPWTP